MTDIELAESSNREASVEGCVYFHSVGQCCVEWYHRRHGIVLIVPSEYAKVEPHGNIHIFFDGKDVTDQYIEQITSEDQRIRTTLTNINLVITLIDQYMDEYEETEALDDGTMESEQWYD